MLCIHENKCWLWCNWGIKVNLIKYIPIMHSHPTLLRLFFCHLWEYFSIKFIFLSFIQNYPTEGNNRGWDGWMASPTQWTWVWANSGRQWRTVACCRPRGLKSRTWLGNWTATTVSFYHVFLCLSLKYFLSVLILQPWVHEKRRLTKCTADVLLQETAYEVTVKTLFHGAEDQYEGGKWEEGELSPSTKQRRTQRNLPPLLRDSKTLLSQQPLHRDITKGD